jgi:hypothetical protein
MGIHVGLDPAARLMGCLLAAGDWPLVEQATKAHLAHRLAEQTRRALATLQADPLVVWANQLAQDASPATVLHRLLNGEAPFDLESFARHADIQAVFAAQTADWQVAMADLAQVLDRPGWTEPLDVFFPLRPAMVTVTPNLLYPALHAVTAAREARLVVACPPPLAWGASPPWRFGERPEEALVAVTTALARHLITTLAPDLDHDRREQFACALASLVLRDQFGPDSADQYLLIERRTHKWPGLPALAATLSDLRHGSPGADWIAHVFP